MEQHQTPAVTTSVYSFLNLYFFFLGHYKYDEYRHCFTVLKLNNKIGLWPAYNEQQLSPYIVGTTEEKN